MRYQNVLVTGGAGFIGSHLVARLAAEGRTVRVLDNLEPPTHQQPPVFPRGVEFQRGDVRSFEDLDRAMRSMDAILHLAATGGFTAGISRYLEVNSVGTARLLEVAARHRIRKLVVASSVGIYGEGQYRCARHGDQLPGMRTLESLERREWEPRCETCDTPLESLRTGEKKLPEPAHAYSISKYDQERLVLSSDFPAVALRLFLTYGPRQSLTNPYTGVVSIFSTRILSGLAPIVYEDGLQTRDFVYVDDAVEAFLLALDQLESGVYNVGTGEATPIAGLARLLSTLYQRDIEPEISGYFRPGEARHIVADASALCAQGWKPRVPLEEGLAHYASWIKGQGSIADRFGEALPGLRRSGVVRSASTPSLPRGEGLSVIVPAYNEAGNLELLLHHLLEELPQIVESFEVIVVDDGSLDDTALIAERLAAEDDRLRVARHPFNVGFGGAQKTGFREAREDWVVVVPADHQFDVRDLALFWDRRKDFDLVSSCRIERRDPPSRRLVSQFYNGVMRRLYGIQLRDINWVKMWRRSLFDSITVESPGFAVDAEIVAKAQALGFRITEVDVPHHPRTWGAPTGLRLGTILRTARELLEIRPMLKRIRDAATDRDA